MDNNNTLTSLPPNCNDMKELIMTYWIAKCVVYCPGFSSFKAYGAYLSFLKDVNQNSALAERVMSAKPSRNVFYGILKKSISSGLIRSSTAEYDSSNLDSKDLVVRKGSGLFFQDCMIDRTELNNSAFPSVINSTEGEKLRKTISNTLVEKMFETQDNNNNTPKINLEEIKNSANK
jgi:hypothetical protein